MLNDLTKQLHMGQTVRLDEVAWGFQITVLPADQAGLRVVAVGTDFVVLDDEQGGVRRRIPAHLIKQAPTPTPLVPQAA
jgi:hypothetical protein